MAACRNAGAQVPGREDRVKWKTRRARSHTEEDALDSNYLKKTEETKTTKTGISRRAKNVQFRLGAHTFRSTPENLALEDGRNVWHGATVPRRLDEVLQTTTV